MIASADAVIETDPATVSALLWHGRKLADAQRSGDIEARGGTSAVEDFLGLFRLPEATGAMASTAAVRPTLRAVARGARRPLACMRPEPAGRRGLRT
jgi:hypothetical protein